LCSCNSCIMLQNLVMWPIRSALAQISNSGQNKDNGFGKSEQSRNAILSMRSVQKVRKKWWDGTWMQTISQIHTKTCYYFLAHLQCSLNFACKFIPLIWHLVSKLTSKRYAKTINLLCAGNKVFNPNLNPPLHTPLPVTYSGCVAHVIRKLAQDSRITFFKKNVF